MSKIDMLGLKNVSAERIMRILDGACEMKKLLLSGNKKVNALQGKSVFLMFYEPSTRTSSSFDAAAKMLGANCMSLAVKNSSVNKGETLIDTGRTIDSMAADIIVIRHSLGGAPHLLAGNVAASVINAGDGAGEHPTQALLDMFTITQHRGSIKGMKVAIVGDIKFSRVARSNIWGLTALGAEVSVCAPATLLPADIDRLPVKVCKDAREAVKGAGAVMALRLQLERQSGGLFPSIKEYNRYYGISTQLLQEADKGALVMHPGPINRGAEISSEAADGIMSVINEQVTSGVAVRAALMCELTGRL